MKKQLRPNPKLILILSTALASLSGYAGGGDTTAVAPTPDYAKI